jgi:protein-histidine pros-kinase
MKINFEHLVLNETPDAIVVTNPGGRVVYWNKGAEAIFGYTSDEAMGCSLAKLIIPEDRFEEESKILDEVIKTGFATFESIRRKKDGSLVYVDISSKPLRNA